MKKRLAQLYIAGMLLVVSAPLTAMAFHAQTEPIGNEAEVVFPSIVTEAGTWNTNYLPELGAWFEAHYAFRAEIISVNSWLQETFFRNSSSDNVIAGSDGWLYYAATLDDYQHNHNVSERTLYNEAHNLALYQEAVESMGAQFLFTIAPNKNTLYGSHMPQYDKIYAARHSDYERLVPYLEEHGVHYVELADLFDSDNEEDPLYYKRDSHWTETGAILVYNRLLDAAGIAHETYEDVTPTAVNDYYGDLANMLYPDTRMTQPETRLIYLENPAWEYTSDTISVEEPLITTQNKTGIGTLLMYRDSFGNSLLPYMAEAFENATFSKNEPLDGTDLGTYEPDLVIYEKVERHLPTLSSVPAMITGPVRYTSLVNIDAEIAIDDHSATTCESSQTNGYTTISGIAAGDAVRDETRFYVLVSDASGDTVYEAYTVTAVGAGTADSTSRDGAVSSTSDANAAGDYGYLLYLDSASVEGEISNICVLAVNEGENGTEDLTVLYDAAGTVTTLVGAPWADAASNNAADTGNAASDANAVNENSMNGDAAGAAGEDTASTDEADAASATDETADTTDGRNGTGDTTGSESTSDSADSGQAASAADKAQDNKSQDIKAQGAGNASSAATGGMTSDAGNTASASTTNSALTDTSAAGGTTTTDTGVAAGAGSATTDTSVTAGTSAATDAGAAASTNTNAAPDTTATQDTAAATTPSTTPAAPYEVSRVFVEDCGYDSGYWDITYSDGSHQYIDVP